MFYEEIKPLPPLSRYIKLLWVMEADSSIVLSPPQRIVTDGIVELVFHFGDPYYTIFSDGKKARQPSSFIVAQHNHPIEIQPTGCTGIIAARFHPWGAHHFFDMPIRSIPDEVVDARLIWKSESERIGSLIQDANSNRQRIGLLQQFLLERYVQNHKIRDEAAPVIRTIQKLKGLPSIKALTKKLGFTERTLERRFMASVGMPPKQFSRITRFIHACQMLRSSSAESLTQITYDCGYYDQAHFIHDFKQYAGLTPGEFIHDQNTTFDSPA